MCTFIRTGAPGDEIGSLAVGACADLLVVDGNPLDDIRVLTHPEKNLRHAIKAGAVV
ncbi:hypothetical protein [Streptomyces carpinensis]|uniref:Amidohydrolase-related domain-containing protein n=1 Tax=Streptomyces carpinensis TaxID=66369 RepID=A0ABV1VWV3_9ACTN|nr:hypothetical protein [Streptomyces carpinensis]